MLADLVINMLLLLKCYHSTNHTEQQRIEAITRKAKESDELVSIFAYLK